MNGTRRRLRNVSERGEGNAFTLTELLIVLVIVAVLSGILFPVFTRSSAKNRQAQCLSNERQMSTAWLMYSQDYDGRVVPWSLSGRSDSNAFVWDRLLQTYQKNEAVMHCPSSKALVGYTYSANIGGASPSPPLRSLSSLRNPQQSPIIADCEGFAAAENNVPGWSFSFIIPDEKGGAQARAIRYESFKNGVPTGERKWAFHNGRTEAARIKADQHGEGANYIFADGHAKWLHYEKSGDRVMPARKGLDYDSDGVLGDDPKAGTVGLYD
jgi:prepilin-type N-terminal cleavage/methylation domain-containing protein/prepilin-type processing-associated H-X9-DG protein